MRILILGAAIALFCTGCAARAASPDLLVAKIEWQSQPPGRGFVWHEVLRTGKLRGSPEESSPEFADFMNTDQVTLAEEDIVELWKQAAQIVREHRNVWTDAASFPGEGFEQLTINFCHERLGWQVLSLSWPAGGDPQSKSIEKLWALLKDRAAGAKRTAMKSEDLLSSSAAISR